MWTTILSIVGAFGLFSEAIDLPNLIAERIEKKKELEEQQLREKFEQFYLEMQEKKGDDRDEKI